MTQDLLEIGIESVHDLLTNVVYINQLLHQADKEPIPHDILNVFVRRAMDYLSLNNEAHRSVRNHSLPALEKTSNSEKGSLDNALCIGDTGALTHMGYCDKGMHNVKCIKGNAQVGDGNVSSVNQMHSTPLCHSLTNAHS